MLLGRKILFRYESGLYMMFSDLFYDKSYGICEYCYIAGTIWKYIMC